MMINPEFEEHRAPKVHPELEGRAPMIHPRVELRRSM
jgi:hypothetical protein